jgi:uncharacterized membrane protein SpoIIM required for sporulation
MELRRGLKIASFKTRILVLLIAFVLCLAITASGAVSSIGASEAQGIVGEFDKMDELLNFVGLEFIFGNNLKHCIIMFVPGLGAFYGGFVLYSTGRVLAALGVTAGTNPLGLLITLFIYPHAWLEYLSYSLAISESFWLIYAAIRFRGRGFRNELSTAAKAIAICAVLLLLAAFAEMYVITLVST